MLFLPLLMLVSTLQDAHADPVCRADVRWAVTEPQVVSRSGPARIVSLFSAVGQNACFPASISLTAEFADFNDELICSGIIPGVADQEGSPQLTALEVRAGALPDFVRLRNGRNRTQLAKSLVCMNAEGTAMVQPADLERATVLRLFATITTRYGGLVTSELRLAIQP